MSPSNNRPSIRQLVARLTRFREFMLVVIILVGGTVAMLSRNLLKAAVGLGVSSAALATLFQLLGAPYAAGFELSVGAGLISVLFIIAILP